MLSTTTTTTTREIHGGDGGGDGRGGVEAGGGRCPAVGVGGRGTVAIENGGGAVDDGDGAWRGGGYESQSDVLLAVTHNNQSFNLLFV